MPPRPPQTVSAPPPPPRKKKKRPLWRRLLLWFFLLLVALTATAAGLGVGFWFWITEDLPRIERLADYRPPAVTQVYAQGGALMGELFRERRFVIPTSDIPPHVVMAFVAAEDGDFFNHPGVDFWGIVRAAIANFKAGRVVQGGSTITQQVAKTLLLSPQRTYIRKVREMILAWRIERYLSKHDILYLYLNQIYLGQGAYGVQAAAQTYFGKNTRDLTLSEAALMAGLVQAPSRYSPLRYPRRARTRQVYVIERLVADKHITPAQAEAALGQQLNLRLHRPELVPAHYYEETVRQWLEDRFGADMVYEGGLSVQTACDPEFTKFAMAAVELGLDQLTKRHGFQGAIGQASAEELKEAQARPLPAAPTIEQGQVATGLITQVNAAQQVMVLRMGQDQGRLTLSDLQAWRSGLTSVTNSSLKAGDLVRVKPMAYDAKSKTWSLNLVQEPVAQSALVAMETTNGRVRALIGGRSFAQSQFNRATQSRRGPGSSFKPFIYAAALDRPANPYTPASILLDAPVTFDDISQPDGLWRPKNYDAQFQGPVTFRSSLEQSRNVPTVRLLADIGVPYVITYAKRMGIESELYPNLSIALGASGLSLMELTRAYSVFANNGALVEPVMVERVLDRDGRVIYEARPQTSQSINPQTAFVMTSLLKGVVESGTGRGVAIPGRPLAGKTGTTNDLRDAWFIGYAPQLVCGVWVGRDDNEPLGHKETGGRAAGPIFKEFMRQAINRWPAADFSPPEGVVFARVEKPGPAPAQVFEAFKQGTEPGSGQPTAGSAWVMRGSHAPASADPEEFMEQESFANPGQ